MERRKRMRAIWGLAGGVFAVAAIVVPLLVLAGKGQITLTAEAYADVIRFEASGAAELRVQIYDLSEKELWDSGVISSDFVDWDRTDTWGERLANGYYMYLAQAWDVNGSLVLSKTGKVALLPGDKVRLQAAPTPSPSSVTPALEDPERTLQPKAIYNESLLLNNGSLLLNNGGVYYLNNSVNQYTQGMSGVGGYQFMALNPGRYFYFVSSSGTASAALSFDTGSLGLGRTDATAQLDIRNTASQPALRIESSAGTNLIEAYNTGAGPATGLVFWVKRASGDVHAVGAVYAASFITGSADVAERINASEWVEAGDVVEIDRDHPGFFCKSSSPYSRRVAGVISTSPGVILGTETHSAADDWDDNRPVLAIAGRVPVRVTTENGPIQVGDLLVASSVPGVAMKGDALLSVGAVVGKAMEPLDEGEGTIVAQVVLR